MISSVAPTPVMPNTAMAVARPAAGSVGLRPESMSVNEKYCGLASSTSAAQIVSTVKSATLKTEKRSMRS